MQSPKRLQTQGRPSYNTRITDSLPPYINQSFNPNITRHTHQHSHNNHCYNQDENNSTILREQKYIAIYDDNWRSNHLI